ncbi:helix-turn-helix transcriptional regulator [Eubacterium sp.]|uniref:helix-turn-helix transcriptional regulator n=1 Tax=Eubacterium sp. TaxID=142586 RepID=UPI002A8184D1|nr:helix-turn-helix transcriptional regulator [Eubacterium sp.]MDY3812148.1 helix-turn-helix transcriptional regulator [Eubacterium sp.]
MVFKISLKAARVNADMTQEEAAKLLNVDKSTIASWENGKTQPKYNQAIKLSEIYGFPYDYINFSV